MSATAGKVMPRPMGDYNALTEYKVLDIVTYNNRPYMAKQTTTGNLPTNTTYWMNLLNFPTEVDNVPTQNSQNLVYSGGVYSELADKMNADASNAENVIFDGEASECTYTVSVSKDSGDSQTVTLVIAADNENAREAELLKVNIGNPDVYYVDNDEPVYITIDTVTGPAVDVSDVITITAHLNEDDSAAISIASATLKLGSYIDSNAKNSMVIGSGFVEGNGSVASGEYSTAKGNYAKADGYYTAATANGASATGARTWASAQKAVAEGMVTVASGVNSHAAGDHTRAGYANQFVVGEYNDNKNNTLFEVGNGASASSRNNAFEVDKNGYIRQNGDTNRFRFGTLNGDLGYYTGNDVFHKFAKVVVELSQQVTLSTSADTTVTFTDAIITADSWVDPFTSVWGLVPTSVVTTSGQCVLTFAKAQSADTVTVGIRV